MKKSIHFVNNIYYDNDYNSYGNYIKLKNNYLRSDVDYIFNFTIIQNCKSGLLNTTTIRKRFLCKFKKYNCEYCNKQLFDSKKKSDSSITVAHKVPLSLGGYKYIETNFIISCGKCNNARGLLPVFLINGKYKF